MELLLTAQPMSSDVLATTGLINRLVPAEDVLAAAVDLATTIASNAPLAARAARSVIRVCDDLTEADALALEAKRVSELTETEDAREGPLAFIERRAPFFTGR